MSLRKIEALLAAKLAELEAAGRLKGEEKVIAGVVPAAGGFGPRFLLKGYGDRPFLRMNSNSYLRLRELPAKDAVPKGRIVLVSAINPTRSGEGKTTVAIGLTQGLQRAGHLVCLALREPSLGPIFGIKGGGTGGGRCTGFAGGRRRR